ncbi:hypothetical protein WN944_011056 [Citrus x changshan-huyou]|uniref:Uncharacterized protein n=1 Tax=Citrus x changshan-huyou TaxID=2935761 RepID=A0AAP0MVA6_9ROSI
MSFTVIAKVSDFEVAGAHVGRRSIGEQQVASAFCGVHTGHRQCLLAQTSCSPTTPPAGPIPNQEFRTM